MDIKYYFRVNLKYLELFNVKIYHYIVYSILVIPILISNSELRLLYTINIFI